MCCVEAQAVSGRRCILCEAQAASVRRCIMCYGMGCFMQEVQLLLGHRLLRAVGVFGVVSRAASGRRCTLCCGMDCLGQEEHFGVEARVASSRRCILYCGTGCFGRCIWGCGKGYFGQEVHFVFRRSLFRQEVRSMLWYERIGREVCFMLRHGLPQAGGAFYFEGQLF